MVALVVGSVQCYLIYVGLQHMEATGQRRDRELAQQEIAAERQYEEVMNALQAQGDILADIGAGIRALIERPSSEGQQRTSR